MRVLGLARLLRAVCRRWLGGLVVMDDVQLSLFTGELELVDCALDGARLTKLLGKFGLRCRVTNARAARVAISLPITWRRGARIRIVVTGPSACLEVDAAPRDPDPTKPARALWRRLALRVAEAVDLDVRCAAARCVLTDGAACGAGFGRARIAASTPDGETWRKVVDLTGLYAYTEEDAADWDAGDAYALSAALVADAAAALLVPANVVLAPAALRGVVALTRQATGLRLDVDCETAHAWRANASAKRLFAAAVAMPREVKRSLSSQSLDSVGDAGSVNSEDLHDDGAKRLVESAARICIGGSLRGALKLQVRDRADQLLCDVAGSLELRASCELDENGLIDYEAGAALDDVYVGAAAPATPAQRRWCHLVRRRRVPSVDEDHAIGQAWLSASGSVVKVALKKSLEGLDCAFYCRHLDLVLHYPLIGRLKGAFGGGAARPLTTALRCEFATSDCCVELPYDWDVDRGGALLGWAHAQGALDTARPDPTIDGSFGDAFAAFCAARLDEPYDGPVAETLLGADLKSRGFYLSERTPLDYDFRVDRTKCSTFLRASSTLAPVVSTLEGAYLALGVSRFAEPGRRIGLKAGCESACHIVVDGPRLARVLHVVGQYLGGPPPLDCAGSLLPSSSDEEPRTNQVDVALDVPLCRVVLLGPEESDQCLLVTVHDLGVRFRQRSRAVDAGFRAQTYRFRDATISLVEERDAPRAKAASPPRDSAKTIVRGTQNGAFEYLSRWPALVRPGGSLGDVCAAQLQELFGDAAEGLKPTPDGLKRLVVEAPVVRCAVSEALFGFRCLLALLKGFQAKCWWVAYDAPESEVVPSLIRVASAERALSKLAGSVDVASAVKQRRDQLLQRAVSRSARKLKQETVERINSFTADDLRFVARLEYDLRRYDVVLTTQKDRRPLIRCRGDAVYTTDDDQVSQLERVVRVDHVRIDSYRVRTARWEPFIEPGLAGTAATCARAGKPSRCCLAFDESATVEATLTRDAALALRSLFDEVRGAADAAPRPVHDDRHMTRLKNATGVDVFVDAFDADGTFLEKIKVPRTTDGIIPPHAAHVVLTLKDGETTWTVERPLPCRTAARILASTTAGVRRSKSPYPDSMKRRMRAAHLDASRNRPGPPLTWSGAFDGRGSLKLTVRSSLMASNRCGCDVVVSAGGRDSLIARGQPDQSNDTPLAWPLADALYFVDDDDDGDAATLLPRLTVGAGPRAAVLDARAATAEAPWRLARASVLRRRWVLCRVVADDAAQFRATGKRLELRAPLVLRNHLPVAVAIKILAPNGKERRCAQEALLAPGQALAVASVDVRDYCWLATKCAGQASWTCAKINARSWRRAVAASKALGRRPPKRCKALEAVPTCGYVLDVATHDRDLALGPLLAGGSAPAVALEATLRAPCVVIDRSSLAGLAFAASRIEAPVQSNGLDDPLVAASANVEVPGRRRFAAFDSIPTPPLSQRRRCSVRHEGLAWVPDGDGAFLRHAATRQIMTRGADAAFSDFALTIVARRPCTVLVACDAPPAWLDALAFAKRGGERDRVLYARSDAALATFGLYERQLKEGETLRLGAARGRYMYAVFATARDERRHRHVASCTPLLDDDGYASAWSREEDEFYDCADEAPATTKSVHVLNAHQSLVASRDGCSTVARLADAASLGGPVPLDVGGAKLSLYVVAGPTGSRVATVVPRVVVANALEGKLFLDGLTIAPNGLEAYHGSHRTSLKCGDGATGDLRLDRHGSQAVALSPNTRVASLASANVLRVEARPRLADGDDFATLCCVGRDDGDAPLLSVANETDVLVACWQRDVKDAPVWLVAPRSSNAFGWAEPERRGKRVCVVAFASRSQEDAAAAVQNTFAKLQRASRSLRLDAAAEKRLPLPLIDASDGFQVLDGPWGVDARVDQRAGGRVLRLCAKTEEVYAVGPDAAALSGAFAFRAPRCALSIVLDDAEGKARREALFARVTRVDVTCKSALDASGKAGAAVDLAVGDLRVESHARNARLRVVLERDDANSDDVLHASLARQRDGSAEVWRYAGLHVAPLAVALDRVTLGALFEAYEAIVAPALGRADDTSITAWARSLSETAIGAMQPPRATRTAVKRGVAGDAASLFAAFASEPKLFVDAVELDPMELRCTLALAATHGNDDNLEHVDLVAPLAAMSDASFKASPFTLRQALLPARELRSALVAHARREVVRQLFGVVLDVPQTLLHDLGGGDVIGGVTRTIAAPTTAISSGVTALGDRLAGAHALLSGDAAYFCERARRRRRRRRRADDNGLAGGLRAAARDVARGAAGGLESLLLDAPRATDARDLCGALVGAIVKPVVGAADALASVAAGLSHDCRVGAVDVRRRGSVDVRRRSSIQNDAPQRTARRRALPALPDGAGPRRLVVPFSARGAAAQALCRGAFPRRFDNLTSPLARAIIVDRPARDDDDGGGLSLGGAAADDDRGDCAADGEPYVWHCSLADGGLLALATPGLVVLTEDRSTPWVAKWRDVRCVQDGATSVRFEVGHIGHDPLAREAPPPVDACRAECGSPRKAARLRAALRAVGTLVDGGGDDGDAFDDDASDGDAALPAWLETAARAATAPPERRNCLREQCSDALWRRGGENLDGDASPGSTPGRLL